MARCKFIVMVNAKDGRDEEFNRWYDERHLADVCAIPGVISAERARLVAGDGSFRYLTMYEFDTEDPEAVLAEITRRSGTEQMPLSDALDVEKVYMGVFRPA